ncbi:helix-turn-helix domain-containing protein [Phycisphaerales bacterium AB-hyl4]|uniref:Helix-turn-helix domain-containing protein n=1 Tax=Natronomicrosphaera hydrolytica TaxID=3242702 RepID=A0ABV4U1S4_9BACT
MTTARYLSPPAYAKLLGCNVSKVLAWIGDGQLEAIDVSTRPGIGRPRWRISSEAIERFERRRSSLTTNATQRTTPRRRRQRAVPQYV